MTRIVCISDTHMREIQGIPDGDILIHSGDFAIHHDTETDLTLFADWFLALPHKHKVFIPGNHDWVFEKNESSARALLPKVHVLIDQEVTLEGLKIYGTPTQPIFCDWAFNKSEKEQQEAYSKIAVGTDILVTHTPPFGVLDIVDRPKGLHVGSKELMKVVTNIKPKVHIFGHIHEAYGISKHRDTTFINCSLCTTRYEATNLPVVYDLTKG